MQDVLMTIRAVLSALALLGVLGLAGCSEDAPRPAASPTPSLAPSARAAAGVITAADVGEGWKEEEAASSSVAETIYDAQVAKCEKRSYVQPRAQEIGKLLTRADGLAQVSSRVRVHASEQIAEEEIASRTSRTGLECAEKQARATARERLAGAQIEKLTFRAGVAPAGVDVLTVSELVAIAANGRRAVGYVEVLEVRRGALVASATITSFNQPVEAGLRAKVAEALLRRAQ